LEHKGRGVLLLHDIHPATVAALPILLKELKARGYRIVHVVPASKENPKTETTAETWLVRDRPRQATPQLALVDVQSLNADFLLQHSPEDLCSLSAMTGKSTRGKAITRHVSSPSGRRSARHSSGPRLAHARPARWDRWW
jgi:hypothetical protein